MYVRMLQCTTFCNLNNWPLFLQSTSLTNIISIIINQPINNNNNKIEDWLKICSIINKSIQIVKFNFSFVNNIENIQFCIEMVQILMKLSTTSLKELHIINADIFLLTNNADVYPSITI